MLLDLQSLEGGVTYSASTALTAHPAIVESARLSLFPTASLAAHPAISESASLATFPALALSAHPGIVEKATLTMFPALAFTAHPAVIEKGTLSIFPVLSLSAHPAIVEGGALLIAGTLTLTTHPAFGDSGGLAFLETVALAAHPSVVENGTLVLPVSMGLLAHPSVFDQAGEGEAVTVMLSAHAALAGTGGLAYLGTCTWASFADIAFGEDVSSIELPPLEAPLTALERRLSMKYAQIQAKIDQGRGRAGLRVGQPYSVYRIQGNAAVHYADPVNLVAQNVDVLRRKLAQNPGLETPTRMGTLYYEVVGDFTRFKVGDLFVQTDPIYGAGATQVSYPTQQMNAWILAIHAPVKKTLAARVDRFAQVYRPDTAPSPPPDTVTQPGYWESYTLTQALPLVLTLGNFALGAQAQTACLVPIGLQSSDRVLGRLLDDVPGMPGKTRWFAYVPPLPGFTFREGDILVMQDLSRYIVFHPYAQEAGFSGSQLVLERVLAQG